MNHVLLVLAFRLISMKYYRFLGNLLYRLSIPCTFAAFAWISPPEFADSLSVVASASDTTHLKCYNSSPHQQNVSSAHELKR
jgi:hypothetical protein